MGVPNPFFDPFFFNPRVKKKEFGNPITFETHIQGKILYLLVIGFLFKTGICSKKMAGIPLCATNLHMHIVIPAFLLLLLKVWKITRGEKMLEVVAVSSVHHVGCTPCGVKKVILKPCSYPTI